MSELTNEEKANLTELINSRSKTTHGSITSSSSLLQISLTSFNDSKKR
jgi:hypothetical protein